LGSWWLHRFENLPEKTRQKGRVHKWGKSKPDHSLRTGALVAPNANGDGGGPEVKVKEEKTGWKDSRI